MCDFKCERKINADYGVNNKNDISISYDDLIVVDDGRVDKDDSLTRRRNIVNGHRDRACFIPVW